MHLKVFKKINFYVLYTWIIYVIIKNHSCCKLLVLPSGTQDAKLVTFIGRPHSI